MIPAELAVTHHFVDLPTLRMHYVSRGTGPVVVLLHGFPEHWWSWRHQIAELADAGFQVIAPDLRGYGESGTAGPYDLDTLAGDVTALIESLGAERRVRVVGHDWGGVLAWHLAATRPQFVDRLTVINAPHPVRMQQALLTRPSLSQLRRSWYIFFFQLPWLPEAVLRRDHAAMIIRTLKASVVDRTHFGDDELKPFRDAFMRPAVASAMVGWYRAAFKAGFSFKKSTLPTVTCPTQIFWGMQDAALGFELVEGMESLATRTEVVPINDGGHFVHAERPEALNPRLIEFLKRWSSLCRPAPAPTRSTSSATSVPG